MPPLFGRNMKIKSIKWLLPFLIVLCFLLCLPTFKVAKAYSGDPLYRYKITQYNAHFDVNTDYSADVREEITILFEGYDSTGIYRYIPINGGDSVTKLGVKELVGGVERDVSYDVFFEDEFICASIGDYSGKMNEYHTYVITYHYGVSKPKSDNTFYLNVIGFDWNTTIDNYKITFTTPANTLKSATYLFGNIGTTTNHNITLIDNKGTIQGTDLNDYQGVTLTLNFEEGVLHVAKADIVPYYFIAGSIVFVLLAILIITTTTEKPLTPVVNIEVPDKMDPLLMGKLIDNNVSVEDITSLLYYWASKGYIKINLENETNPEFIRIYQHLPNDTPQYQQIMYNDLFKGKDTVTVKQLENVFYVTIDKVKKLINTQNINLYQKNTYSKGIILSFFSTLYVFLVNFIYSKIVVNNQLSVWETGIIFIPTIAVYVLAMIGKQFKVKSSKTYGLFTLASGLVAVVASIIFAFLTPNFILPFIPAVLLSIISYMVVILSALNIRRTDEYTDKLNDIVGFKNFIQFAEKDRLEALLEEDPEFYYNILPYAQVLGVSNIWEDKFKSIAIEPPRWLVRNDMTMFDYMILNHAIRNSTMNMVRTMNSRPSSSGKSGAGGFGSFGGGGHGGGGGRGR